MIEAMIRGAKEKVDFAFLSAAERKVDSPVVLVLDLRGDGGSWAAERFADRSKIEEVTAESEKRGTMPLLTIAVSRYQTGLLLGELNPDARTSLDNVQIPDTHFLVIGIADKDIGGQVLPKP